MKKNYVEINGVRSETINGLLISELPPISKPLMRSEIEEIDGMDGAVVTKLGYSCYEREMVVGLFGDYDIDEVIKFFAQDGEIIFSNEPDKKYRFQMLSEIDFERLGKFRTGVVTFYVEPFKYSAVDETMDVTPTGNSLEIWNNGNIASKPKLTLYGTGTVSLTLRNSVILVIAIGSNGYITIDAEKMEAYKGDVLKNRSVAGNYDDLRLDCGKNLLSWSGYITRIIVENRSRWI